VVDITTMTMMEVTMVTMDSNNIGR